MQQNTNFSEEKDLIHNVIKEIYCVAEDRGAPKSAGPVAV